MIFYQLWFSHRYAPRVYDVFEFTYIQNKEDGIYVTAPFPEDEWLYSFLLSYGVGVRVIQPEHIKKELKNRLMKQSKKSGGIQYVQNRMSFIDGSIGIDAIATIINHPLLRELPFYLETPNDVAG